MLLEKRLVDADGVLAHQHGVAVRRRGRDHLPGDVAAGAALVLDHDRLAELGLQLIRNLAEERVGGAARRESNDEFDRPVRIAALRQGECRRAKERSDDRAPPNDRPHGGLLNAMPPIRPRAGRRVDRAMPGPGCGTSPLFHSALMPLVSISRVQFLISFSSLLCNAGPGMTSGVMSSLASRSRTAGSAITLAIACAIFPFTASAMPFGPKIANQKRNSTLASGTPASCMVGTLGMAGERCGLVTANALTLPASTSPLVACTDEIVIATWPAITSPIAWPPPL